MKMKTMFRLTAGLIVSAAFALAGCGGDTGKSATSAPAVSGTASEGALILGKTVKLKDANGKAAKDATTDATSGSYSIDVSGLTAPFLLTVTGSTGQTYISLAKDAGKANINPITTTVVALAAGTSDPSALFSDISAAQLKTIAANYTAKAELITTALQAALPAGSTAADYFTGTIEQGKGIDALFDTYKITVDKTAGINFETKVGTATNVLTITAETIKSETTTPLPEIKAEYTITLDSDLTTQVAGQNITLTADVKLNGATVSDGKVVTFSATGGNLSAPTATTTGGKATVTITATSAGSANVTATVGSGNAAKTLTFTPAPVHAVTLVSDVATQEVNKNITLTATATVNGSPVADGTEITFATTSGTLSSIKASTKDGKATVSITNATAGNASVTAAYGATTSSPRALTFTAAPVYAVTLASNVATQEVNKNITLTATATVNGSPVADGTTITFTSTATLSSATATTTGGKASVTITNATAGSTNVTATISDKTSAPLALAFTAAPVPQVYTVALGSDLLTQVAGQNITLTADVKLNNATAPNGTIVTFTNTGGTLSAPTATTTNGKASVTITAAVAANASTTASVGTTTSNALALTFTTPPDTYLVELSSDKTSQVSGQNITLTATVKKNGVAMADGTTITFATSNGALSATTATMTNGKATVTLSAPAAGAANVTAAYGTTTTAPLALTFTAPPQVYAVAVSSDVNTQYTGKNITLTANATLNGAAVADGTVITFATTSGTLSAATATTTGGKATVTITAAAAGSANVTASVGGVTSSAVALTFTAAPTQVVLKLKTTGTLASGKQVGGWQATIKMPATGISIKTKSATNKALDTATAFLKSGVTPSSFTFNGSYNVPDATYPVPYVMVSNAGDVSDPLVGTAVGEVATLTFDIASGAAIPVKSDFVLTGISVAEAVVGVPALAGISMDFDISYK